MIRLFRILSILFLLFLNSKGIYFHMGETQNKCFIEELYSHEGKFSFTSHTVGDYKICLSTNSSHWFGGELQRVHFDLAIGNQAEDYKDVASREKLNDIQLRTRQLIDQVEMIFKDQGYQRVREEQFRQISMNTNSRVTWWSIIQVLLLICIGIWQMRNLKSFFQAKKLV